MQDRRPDNKPNDLYATDFYAWTQEQARLLRDGCFADLDLENLAEEVRSVGVSDKRQIRNRLKVLIAHLLKWKYQPGLRSPGWGRTIHDQRAEIASVIEDSPSLRSFPADCAVDCYPAARQVAADETGIDYTLFPDACPFSPDQILDPDFLPKEPDLEPPD